MVQTYEIKYGASPVGVAQMEMQGLYCRISCRCTLPDRELYRVHAAYPEKRVDLGICVPQGDSFGMDMMIPVKHLGTGEPVFELLPKDWKPEDAEELPQSNPTVQEQDPVTEESESAGHDTETFLPVWEDEPFEQLDILENAVLEVRDDQIGVIISEEE